MIAEDYKTVDALLTIKNRDISIQEWGKDVVITEENIIFKQGYRTIIYPKQLVQKMEMHVCQLSEKQITMKPLTEESRQDLRKILKSSDQVSIIRHET